MCSTWEFSHCLRVWAWEWHRNLLKSGVSQDLLSRYPLSSVHVHSFCMHEINHRPFTVALFIIVRTLPHKWTELELTKNALRDAVNSVQHHAVQWFLCNRPFEGISAVTCDLPLLTHILFHCTAIAKIKTRRWGKERDKEMPSQQICLNTISCWCNSILNPSHLLITYSIPFFASTSKSLHVEIASLNAWRNEVHDKSGLLSVSRIRQGEN